MAAIQWFCGDSEEQMRKLPSKSVQLAVTSPPYLNLRDYQMEGQIGLEATPEEYVAALVRVFRELRRVLRDDGVMFLNLGDSYASAPGKSNLNLVDWCAENARGGGVRAGGHETPRRPVTPGYKPKDLIGIPFRVAFALQADGWYLRSIMPWVKRACMPESVTSRPTSAVEYVFLLAKSEAYFYDAFAVKEPDSGRTSGQKQRKLAGEAKNDRVNTHMGSSVPWTSDGSGRNYRNSSMFFGSLRMILEDGAQGLVQNEEGSPLAFVVNPKPCKEAHFAVFPEAFAETCIRAGTSEKGQCATCGAPWVRSVTRPERPGVGAADIPINPRDGLTNQPGIERVGMSHRAYAEWLRENPQVSTGWRPSCSCPVAAPVPQTVIDPFSGAGTTQLVASRLGRDSIYIDLNPDYMEIAHKRVTSAT